jgi:hypothetical protein
MQARYNDHKYGPLLQAQQCHALFSGILTMVGLDVEDGNDDLVFDCDLENSENESCADRNK